jgi:hypothetical protein
VGKSSKHQWSKIWNPELLFALLTCSLPFSGITSYFGSYSLLFSSMVSLLLIFVSPTRNFKTCQPAILPPLKDIYEGNITEDFAGLVNLDFLWWLSSVSVPGNLFISVTCRHDALRRGTSWWGLCCKYSKISKPEQGTKKRKLSLPSPCDLF